MDLHNTSIKKNASEIFETNAFDETISQVKNEIYPIVKVEPYINIVKSSNATGTLYTTPSDKDFYLTNINLFCASDSGGPTQGSAQITFTPKDSAAVTYQILTSVAIADGEIAQAIQFPFRGVLLAKGTTITIATTATGYVMIAGYTGSDRS